MKTRPPPIRACASIAMKTVHYSGWQEPKTAYWLPSEVPKALQVCHHLHGGLGVDTTYPLHRYYSHGKDLARFVGGAALRLDSLGDRCSSN